MTGYYPDGIIIDSQDNVPTMADMLAGDCLPNNSPVLTRPALAQLRSTDPNTVNRSLATAAENEAAAERALTRGQKVS